MEHSFCCHDCGVSERNGIAWQVSSRAEWHNTMTGHDVSIVIDGTRFTLVDDGWVLDSEIVEV